MRYLLAIILIAALGWSGYWVYGSSRTEAAVQSWLDAREAEGWVANYERVETKGFPNRFDTTIFAPELADPETGVAWSAPYFQLFSLSYKPQHIIAVWPSEQVLATPLETLTLTSDDLRASLIVEPLNNLALDRSTIDGQNLRLGSTAGWQASAQKLLLAMRQVPAETPRYDLALTLQDASLPAFLARLSSRVGLPENALGHAELEATADFDSPWDLAALESERPQPRRLDISRARLAWGELELQSKGVLDIDGRGRASGELSLRATHWREMLKLAEATGAMSGDLAGLVEGGLNLIARMSGDDRSIDVPLRFRDGNVTLGGVIPLGKAPLFVLR